MTDPYSPLPVPCAGCGKPTPYETGPGPSEGTSFGEFLMTDLGYVFVRTHWQRSCVRAARRACGGSPYTPPVQDPPAQLTLTVGMLNG